MTYTADTVDLARLSDGSCILVSLSANRVQIAACGEHSPAFGPAHLNLAEVEALRKALGKLAAKLRGKAGG